MNTQPFIILDNLLSPQQLSSVDALLSSAQFVAPQEHERDGVRNNLQLPADERSVMPQIHQILNQALMQQPVFQALLAPLRMVPFTVTRYDQGHSYGWHVDHPIIGNPPVRTDMAITIFLSEPTACEGGELEIQTPAGTERIKPARGSAVIYPCHNVHRVNEVTAGRRIAAIGWIQSAVRNPQQRDILFNLQRVYQSLSEKGENANEASLILQSWSNLMRLWAEG
ncbi:MAG: Fe2+-dependent dioxygenase [Bacteroidia bacterium]